jgi:hypothetical protein
MKERHCPGALARFALLLFIAAAPLCFTAHAHAQDTLRVGRAIVNSWSFVPLDVGMGSPSSGWLSPAVRGCSRGWRLGSPPVWGDQWPL